MNMIHATYTGRGFDKIVNYIDTEGVSGTITGHIVRINGEKIASIDFSIKNDNLYLTVNGVDFSNVTEAIRYLTVMASTNNATGSNDDGNSANNVIGNYAIMRHIMFGSVSLEQIVGKSDTSKTRVTKLNRTRIPSVSITRLLNAPAREGFFKMYPDYSVIKGISGKFNLTPTKMSFLLDTLTTNEFQLMFGRTENDFDLTIYKI